MGMKLSKNDHGAIEARQKTDALMESQMDALSLALHLLFHQSIGFELLFCCETYPITTP